MNKIGFGDKFQSMKIFKNHTVATLVLANFETLHLLNCPRNLWDQTVFCGNFKSVKMSHAGLRINFAKQTKAKYLQKVPK